MNDNRNQYELLKTTYLFNATKYIEAIKRYGLGHFSGSGVKSEIAKLHHDMIISSLPLYKMISQVTIEF